jgi:DNA primase
MHSLDFGNWGLGLGFCVSLVFLPHMSSNVERIKAKIDIVSLVGSYMKLEKSGSNLKGRCPFHNEKTPSFFVSPDRGSYYCFGCQAKGDIFTFVQEFEGLDFIGSLKVLADRAGIVLESGQKGENTDKERLHGVLEQAVFFFQKQLVENPEALAYVHSRGITDATIASFRIGYAPLDWRQLHDYLLERSVPVKDMLDTGLVKHKENTSSHYDTFRGRIMFPICDSSGRPVGFSGRIIIPDEKSPKYLNSPETSLFIKSETLFGLDKAKREIRVKDYSILVEGQMDLVMLHQAGIANTVASSGTALTSEHLIKLRRLSNRIIMAYDGDSAGFSASNRSAQLALSLGMELKVAVMPEGKDPADLAKEDKEELIERLKHAKHIIDFYTEALLARDLEPRELGQEIQKHVLPYIAILGSTIERSHFIKSIAQRTFIKEDALWDDLKKLASSQQASPPPLLAESPPAVTRTQAIERKIIGIIMWQEQLGTAMPGIDREDLEKRAKGILKDEYSRLRAQLEQEKDALVFETEAYYNGKRDLASDIQELILGLEQEHLKKEFADRIVLLQKAEQLRDSAQVLTHLEECQRISQRINELKIHEKK